MNDRSYERICAELETIKKIVQNLDHVIGRSGSQPSLPLIEEQTPLEAAKRHYCGRRRRDKIFGEPQLFGEPVWDMLVDLFIAAEENKKVSVSSLCIAAAVPMTTALRHIAIVEAMGLVERDFDPKDARRSFLSISHSARESVRAYFEEFC